MRRRHDRASKPSEHRAKQPPDAAPRAAASDVERIHGYRAGLAVIAARPKDVLRIACVDEIYDEVEAGLRRGGSEVELGLLGEREIEKLAHTPQHEGLCLEARARTWASVAELGDLLLEKNGAAIALDRVRNSYNVGAVLRSAAFFGIEAVLLGAPAPHPGLDPNAIRVAEGGAEHLVMARTTDLAETLARLRSRGVKVYGTDGAATTDALDAKLRFERPAVLILGNEREGLGARVRRECDHVIAIRGSGAIESLNVAVASGILVSKLARRR